MKLDPKDVVFVALIAIVILVSVVGAAMPILNYLGVFG